MVASHDSDDAAYAHMAPGRGEETEPFLEGLVREPAPASSPRLRCRKVLGTAAIMVALVGAAAWSNGHGRSAAVSRGRGEFLQAQEMHAAQVMHGPGLEAMDTNADALATELHEDGLDVDAVKQGADMMKKIVADAEKMEGKEASQAEELREEAAAMVNEATEERHASGSVRDMAEKDMEAAKALSAQSEADIAGAKKIEKEASGGGMKAIVQMAKDQQRAAKNGLRRARQEVKVAKGMTQQADELIQKANETEVASKALKAAAEGKLNETELVDALLNATRSRGAGLESMVKTMVADVSATKEAWKQLDARVSRWNLKLGAAGEARVEAEQELTAAKLDLAKPQAAVNASGTNGANGTNSTNGTTGTNGANGTNSTNGTKDGATTQSAAATKESMEGALAKIKALQALQNQAASEDFQMEYKKGTVEALRNATVRDNETVLALVASARAAKAVMGALADQAAAQQEAAEGLEDVASSAILMDGGASGSTKALREASAQESGAATAKLSYVRDAQAKLQSLDSAADNINQRAAREDEKAAELEGQLGEEAARRQAKIDAAVKKLLDEGKGCCSYEPDKCKDVRNPYCDAGATQCGLCTGTYIVPPGYQFPAVE